MRKTSQDGGDSTSITSGFENEIKKTSVGIIKTKRNSIKRKVQNFSHESDDTVIEPLLQIDKNETISRSAKYLLSKSKTESISEKESDIYSDNKIEKTPACKSICTTESIASSSNVSKTLHNYMNTNIFGVHDGTKDVSSIKCPLLVEINGCRPVINTNQTSSIFTTAKINANSINKNMEPIQVTPVPILSTIEGNIVKKGISPEYAQGKTIVSPTSDVLKSGTKDHLSNKNFIKTFETQPGCSKPDLNKPSTRDNLNKMTSTVDNIPISVKVATGSESKVISKLSDSNIVNVPLIASTTDSVKEPTFQSEVVTTIDKKCTSNQKQSNVDGLTNIQSQKKEPDAKTLTERDNVNVSKLAPKTYPSQYISTTKKESASGISNNKQLQRQKNTILEDPRDSEHHVKTTKKSDEIYEFSKPQTSSSVISSNKYDKITNIQGSTSTTLVNKTEKLRENSARPTVAGISPQPASSLKKDFSVEKTSKISPKEIKTSDNGTTISTATFKKEIISKSNNPDLNTSTKPTQSIASRKLESKFENKSLVGQIDKPKLEEPLKCAVTAKVEIPSSSDSQQLTKPTISVKCDPKNDYEKAVVSPHQASKPETEISKELTTSSVTKSTATKSTTKYVAAVITETSKVTACTKTDTKNTITSEIPKPAKPLIATTVIDKPLSKNLSHSSTMIKTEPKTKPSTSGKSAVTKPESTNASPASSDTNAKPIASISVKSKQDALISEKQKSTTPQPSTSVKDRSLNINVVPTVTTTMTKTEPKSKSLINKSAVAVSKIESTSTSTYSLNPLAKPIKTNSSSPSSTSTNQNVISKVSSLDKHDKI